MSSNVISSGDCAGYNLSTVGTEERRLGSPPNQALDIVVVAMIGIGVIPFIAGNALMVWQRNYLPIKYKRVDATVISSIGGLIWIAATIVVNGHFGRPKDTFWTVCTLWTFWLQLGLGFALWLNCLIVRMWRLHRLIIQLRKTNDNVWGFWIPLVVLLLPVMIFCICASAQHASNFRCIAFNNDDVRGDCIIKNWRWAVSALVILPFYFIVLVVLTFQLRNVRDEFNEYSTVRNGGIIAFFLFFLAMVILSTKTYYQVTGRCFFTLAVSAEVFYFFWIRNWEPIWNVLFNKQKYLDAFLNKLRTQGGLRRGATLEQLDATAAQFVVPDGGNTHTFKAEEQHMGDVEAAHDAEKSAELETMLAATRREAEEQRIRAADLEETNRKLREEVSRLRHELQEFWSPRSPRSPQSPGASAHGNGLGQENGQSPKATNGG
eukprot:TRINITY_DN3621_c0_g1_i1.p1 TRINITY_DN3621_c0_g1~~TRINITY_DN3621_c0_g1_i1.p1  ORF type:complete len:434 (+),score=112.28 TRINITY_DN3621_c0_g1_i1:397-1698(+)